MAAEFHLSHCARSVAFILVKHFKMRIIVSFMLAVITRVRGYFFIYLS